MQSIIPLQVSAQEHIPVWIDGQKINFTNNHFKFFLLSNFLEKEKIGTLRYLGFTHNCSQIFKYLFSLFVNNLHTQKPYSFENFQFALEYQAQLDFVLHLKPH